MKNLYYIRHGESEANKAGVSGGHTDSALTSKGKEQAEEAGQTHKTDPVASKKLSYLVQFLSVSTLLLAIFARGFVKMRGDGLVS